MSQERGEAKSHKEVEGQDEATMSREAAKEVLAIAKQKEDNTERVESIDDLLDAMDDILEENAEEFVAAYKQKGGE